MKSCITRQDSAFVMRRIAGVAMATALVLVAVPRAAAVDVRVTVENLGAPGSVFLTPFWLGVHNGTFDLYDNGVSAAGFGGLESLAEDGDTAGLSTRFATEQGGTGGVDATLAGPAGPPPIDPGETASLILSISNPTINRYLSYASMIVPSNDAFIANGNPLARPIFDAAGNFLGADFTVLGSAVLDAGTEVDNETSVAFLAGPNGQTGPNQGANQNGVVSSHLGFNGSVGNPAGVPVNILGGTTASGAMIDTVLGDFTRNGGQDPLVRITVSFVPEPTTATLASFGAIAALVWRRHRAKRAGRLA